MATQQIRYPAPGSNASVSTTAAAVPAQATFVAGQNPSGNLQPLMTDSSGYLYVNILASGTISTQDAADGPVTPGAVASKSMLMGGQYNSSLPTLTSAQQCAIQLDSSGRQIISPLTNSSIVKAQLQDNAGNALNSTSNALNVNVQNSSITVQPGNTANTTPWLMTISQGGNSATVSAGGALKVDGSASTQPVSGTVTANIGTSGSLALDATVSNVQGSVSGGTAGSKSSLAGGQYNSSLPSLTTGQQVALQLDSSGRQIIAPLTNTSIVKAQLQDNAGTAITLGQKTMASSIPVVLASDQAAIPVSQSGTWNVRNQDGSGNSLTSSAQGSKQGLNTSDIGFTAQNKARNVYSSTNVTTSAYVQLIASTAADIQEVEIFDSSGQTLVLATGAVASEVDQIYIFPGGNGRVKLRIASGTRVAIKAVSANATSGEIDVNFYG